ncbi:MAG: DUF2442 domain-containing protein [Bdellovibrionales bacterium]
MDKNEHVKQIAAKIEEPNLIDNVWCTDHELVVKLKDSRRLNVPLWWYPRLEAATPAQRANFEIMIFGVHWPDVDEDISIQGLIEGRESPRRKTAIRGRIKT